MVRWSLVVLMAAVLAVPGSAFGALNPDRLARLVNAGHMKLAWELARENRAGLEGDPVFDLYYGLAAVGSGHLSEGVFALRRLLAVRPGLDRARVALARAYFEMGNDLAARREFERVLAGDPPAPVRAGIERYLDALDRRASRYRTALSGYVEFGGGHDSNVNSATDLDSVNTTLGPRLINPQGREQADDFARVAGGLRITRPLTPDLGAFVSAAGERRYLDEHDEFAIGGALLRTGLTFRGDRSRGSLGVHGQRLYVDGEAFRDMGGLDADLRYALSDLHVLELSGRWSQLDYDAFPDRDSDLWELSAGTTGLWRVSLRPVASFSLSYGEEAARRDTPEAQAGAQRDLYGATGELRLQLAPAWTLSGDIGYQRSEYAGVDPLFGAKREDDYYSTKLMLEWQPRQSWRLQLHLTHAVNDSNLDFHDYDRSVAELRLRRDFYY